MSAATRTTTWTGDAADPYFMGYWIKSEGATPTPYETVRITAHTPWVTSGTYAGDCEDYHDPCLLATECTTSGSVLKLLSAHSRSSECAFQEKCHTLTIYASSPEGRPTAYNIACREEDWSMGTLFRVSPTSSDVSERTSTGVSYNGDDGRSEPSIVSGPIIFGIVAACLVGISLLACGIWAPFYWRQKRRSNEEQGQLEISMFAQTRGYVAGNEAAVQPAAMSSESTISDTRNATVGETVPSTVDFVPDERSQQRSDATAQSQNGPTLTLGTHEASR